MRNRLEQWARWVAETLPARCVRRFVLIDGRNRSLILAGQAFTTVIPLLIITASVTSATGSRTVGDDLVARFHLSGDSADAMRALFGRPPAAGGTMSLVGLVVLLASLLSLTRSLQRTYEAAWGLPPSGIPGTVNGLTGMSLLIAQLIVLTLLASALRGVPAGSVITALVRFLAAVPLWLIMQYLLLSRRVRVRALIPGAVVGALGQLAVSVYSALWMPRVVAGDAARYGLIGVTFALVSWLIVIGLAVVAGAVLAAELAVERSPGVARHRSGSPGRPLTPDGRSGASRTGPNVRGTGVKEGTKMAELVVLGFRDKEQAEQAMATGASLQKQELLDLEDAALVWRELDGKIKVQQSFSTTGAGAATGAMWGTLFGMLFLMPVFGMAVGAASGALAGKLSDVGIDDSFIKEVAATLEPGTVAVFGLVRRSTPDKVRAALAEYRPTVIRTSLTKDKEEELAAALRGE